VESARDHEVEDEVELVVECEDDSFAETGDAEDAMAGDAREWRIVRAHDKGACQSDGFDLAALQEPGEGFDVDGDVGKLGQRSTMGAGLKESTFIEPTSLDMGSQRPGFPCVDTAA
jgi:hypothetical protein